MLKDKYGMALNDFDNLAMVNVGGMKSQIIDFVTKAEEVDVLMLHNDFVMRGYWSEGIVQTVLDMINVDKSLVQFNYDDRNFVVSKETLYSKSHLNSLHTRLQKEWDEKREVDLTKIKF